MISPIINIRHDCCCCSRAMNENEILTDPGDEVVLERAFDDLVEEIRAQQLMDIGAGKSDSEWLYRESMMSSVDLGYKEKDTTYNNITNNAVVIPQYSVTILFE
jgi:hypothetical protein